MSQSFVGNAGTGSILGDVSSFQASYRRKVGAAFGTNDGGATMCDFSLMHAKSRPAEVADKLVTKDFGRGTIGFASISDRDTMAHEATAVCVLPGTELSFDKPVEVRNGWYGTVCDKVECLVARFRQVDTESLHMHHDALEFATGQIIKLTTLHAGQTATVLQLPAQPKNEQEAKEQTRLEVVA